MDLSERGAGNTTRHPWETARAAFFINLLRDRGYLAAPSTWLDVGAGDGWLTMELAEAAAEGSTFSCWDINYSSDEPIASHPAISFSAQEPQARFDNLLLLDVIEHVVDDQGFLNGLVQERLDDSGMALVSVPAWPSMFSAHDVALHHHRRYTPAAARAVIERAGLQICREGGLFHSLLLPRAAQVLGERLGRPAPSTGVGSWEGGPRLTTGIDRGLKWDGQLSRWFSERAWRVPGLSYWALCRKPGTQ